MAGGVNVKGKVQGKRLEEKGSRFKENEKNHYKESGPV